MAILFPKYNSENPVSLSGSMMINHKVPDFSMEEMMNAETPNAFIRDYWGSIRSYVFDLRLLVLLLLTDCVFIVLHIIHKFTALLPDLLYNIEFDGGYGELFQYIKEVWIVLLLIDLAIRRKQFLYFAWCLLITYLLLDDMFQFHEQIGGMVIKPFLVETFGRESRLGIQFKDYGELLVSVIAGSPLLLCIGLFHFQADKQTKIVSTTLFMLLGLVAFFGIAVDMLHEHIWVQRARFLNWDVLGLFEDSGEMVVMTVMAWFVYNISHAVGKRALAKMPQTAVVRRQVACVTE